MEIFLLLILSGDAIAGFACIRRRLLTHAVVLGGLIVPLSLGVAALTFAALDQVAAADPARFRLDFFLAGSAALGAAAIAVLWMAWAALCDGTSGRMWR